MSTPGCTWRENTFFPSAFLVWALNIFFSHRNAIVRQSSGVVELLLLINSVLQGISVPNRTFRVGQGARNGALTPYLLVNFY